MLDVQVVAQHLTRDKHYGLAISYCAFANDVRGVGRIAILLLEEYVQHGEFSLERLNLP